CLTFLFFFSSRRRHTRSKRDWSSDVCSSDYMTDFTGSQSPSAVAPGLIWQQPHPIILAEQCYKANPSDEFLNKFKEVVFESADFMVSFAHWDENNEVFVLGPPLIPAQENHRMAESLNPPYEVEYWKFGLEIAIKWAKRL